MLILLSWLQDFVEIKESPQELAHALTMAGMAVDAIEEEDGETVLEFDITSNRPDALNHFGMAREVAAIYRRPLRQPAARLTETAVPAVSRATVEIEDAGACTRYVGRVFEDVRVKPAPDWMRRRLELCGVRSINNLADLTNYVLLEMGQPTHAFDLDTLADRRIVVRRARQGESLVTLDGEHRELTADQLAICDSEKPVALAGVMGGAATEITSETRNVLLEAAWFRPAMVRNASRHFKLFTEASHRFERGADWEGAVQAADRIAALLGETGHGTVLSGRIDCYPHPRSLPVIRLRKERIRRLLGVPVDEAEVEAILNVLGFRPVAEGDGWSVPATSHRLDVEREVDLIEEIARIHGFENIPGSLPRIGVAPTQGPHVPEDERVRASVRGLGYDETIAFPFISASDARRFGGCEGVGLRNPLSNRWDVMRNSAVPTMVRALEWNLRRNQPIVRLAEFGRTYRRSGKGYSEPQVLTLGATGMARPASWNDRTGPVGFYDMKADIVALLQPFATGGLRFDSAGMPKHYRQGHSAKVEDDGGTLALFGELAPAIARERKIRQPVFIAEIFLDAVYGRGLRQPAHARLPKVPAVSRDFSLLIPEGVNFESVVEAVGEMADLKSLEAVEVFRGKKLPKGRYSLLLRASWQRLEESLTDDEVNEFAATLRAALKTKLGIALRT